MVNLNLKDTVYGPKTETAPKTEVSIKTQTGNPVVYNVFVESRKVLCRDMVKINDWAKVVSVAYGSSSKPRRFLRAAKTCKL